jgi:SAM-dependent methyltransferase
MRNYQTGFFRQDRDLQDRVARIKQAHKIEFILKKFAEFPSDSWDALDIGCADGTITSHLSSQFNSMVGIEYDWDALEHSDNPSDSETSFIQGDAMFLPFKDDVFDAVICAQVYEHVPDDRILVQEIIRTLKPKGIVFFSGPNWLYPVEPHYHLPFLHWLPSRVANKILQILQRGEFFYEKSRTIWSLRRLFKSFEILDYSVDVFHWRLKSRDSFLSKLILLVPRCILNLLKPIFPNYNWILIKKSNPLP